MRRCAQCGGELATRARRDTRTCSPRCRVALHRAHRRPPAELRELDRWVRRSERKVPLRADGKGPASATDPTTWTSYADARRSSAGVGVGFVLGEGIACLDLDDCVSPDGTIAAWAQVILDKAPPTYVELSPSGRGLHIWGRGHVGLARKIRDGDRRIEAYDRGRYIALGTPLRGTAIRLGDLSGVLDRL